jgi:hypothetical protein
MAADLAQGLLIGGCFLAAIALDSHFGRKEVALFRVVIDNQQLRRWGNRKSMLYLSKQILPIRGVNNEGLRKVCQCGAPVLNGAFPFR